jgi:putative hemolysin
LAWEVLIVVLSILASGLLAAAEMAISSARRSRLEERAQSGSTAARVALQLAGAPNAVAPAIRVGVTLLCTLAAVLGGRGLAGYLAQQLGRLSLGPLAAYREAIALAAVVLGVAAMVLVLGEIVPKRLALAAAERTALIVAVPVATLARIVRPMVWLVDAVAGLILALLGQQPKRGASVSVEDIEWLLRDGTREGILEPSEQLVASRALHLGDRAVKEIMRPRVEIDAIDVDTPPDEVIGAVAMAGFSRLPVHEGDLDHILGFVYTKDLLRQQHMGWPIELRKLIRPALLVPETLRIDKLLEAFRQKRTQMALVLDEFGGTEGLVTMEDVLEELVGEIHDEYRQEQKQRIVKRDARSWLVDGSVNLDELLDAVGLDRPPAGASRGFTTAAGLVISLLGRIPQVGDVAGWKGLTIEVVDMHGPRIDRLLVSRHA